ncbi:MAG: hypothetical protein M3N57_07570 [Actinomycetota bacterium]|nr:hypothetical protein [Actinomycetota bacterium]
MLLALRLVHLDDAHDQERLAGVLAQVQVPGVTSDDARDRLRCELLHAPGDLDLRAGLEVEVRCVDRGIEDDQEALRRRLGQAVGLTATFPTATLLAATLLTATLLTATLLTSTLLTTTLLTTTLLAATGRGDEEDAVADEQLGDLPAQDDVLADEALLAATDLDLLSALEDAPALMAAGGLTLSALGLLLAALRLAFHDDVGDARADVLLLALLLLPAAGHEQQQARGGDREPALTPAPHVDLLILMRGGAHRAGAANADHPVRPPFPVVSGKTTTTTV